MSARKVPYTGRFICIDHPDVAPFCCFPPNGVARGVSWHFHLALGEQKSVRCRGDVECVCCVDTRARGRARRHTRARARARAHALTTREDADEDETL